MGCWIALILATSAAFNWTFIHHGINRIDESWQLYAAMRLHAGGTLYRDVLWVFPPGHLWSAWIAWWIEPPGLVQARLIYAAFDLALCASVYLVARRLMEQPFALLAGLLVALAAPIGHAFQSTFGFRYLVFSMLALLALDRRLRGHEPYWVVVSGALVGVALVFRLTPAFSVACGIALALVIAHRTPRLWIADGLRFGFGILLVLTPVLLWFSQTVGLERVWQEVVVHPLAMLQPVPLPAMEFSGPWDRIAIHEFFVALQFRLIWLFYFGYAVAVLASWLRGPRKTRSELSLLAALTIFGAVFFIRSLGRSDETHLDSVIPPVCMLVAHLANVCFNAVWPPTQRVGARRLASAALVVGMLGSWIFLARVDEITQPKAANVRRLESTQQKILVQPIVKSFHIDRTVHLLQRFAEPQDTILNLAPTPLFHILSGRTGPGYLDVIMPGTFLTPEAEIGFLERVKADPPAAVVWPLRDFDDMEERSVSRTAPRLSEWVKRNYTPIPRQRSWAVMVWSGGKGGPGAGPIGSGIPGEE